MNEQKTNSYGTTRRTFRKMVVAVRDRYKNAVSEEEMQSINAIVETVDSIFIGKRFYRIPEPGYALARIEISNTIYAAGDMAIRNGHNVLWRDLASKENPNSLINKLIELRKSDTAMVNGRERRFELRKLLREFAEGTPGGLEAILVNPESRDDLIKQIKRVESKF